jgi:quercetin dioxygenase-like cupin family protein
VRRSVRRRFALRRTAVIAAMRRMSLLSAGVACAALAADAPRRDARYWLRDDGEVTRVEPAPHDGTGTTTAYRYFDDVPNPGVIFRKRSLPKGAAIGRHVLGHDEVYYVVSGDAELQVDGETRAMRAGSAAYMRAGADVGIRQAGAAALVVIVAYPPPAAR